MSAAVAFISAVVASIPILNTQWDLVKDVTDALWQEIGKPVLEFIFSVLGIEDENIISAQVNTQRIVTDDVSKELLSRVALDHQAQPDTGIIEHLAIATNTIKGKYSSYYNYGEDTFLDGLPDTTIRGTTVDLGILEDTIETAYGPFSNLVVEEGSLRVPDKFEYTGWYLVSELGMDYRPWDMTIKNGFIYPDERYQVQTIEYNFTTDEYDIGYNLQEDVTTTTSTRTTVSISDYYETTSTVTSTITTVTITANVDPLLDNKNVLVEEEIVTTAEYAGQIGYSLTVISDTDSTIPTGTESASVDTVVDSTVPGTVLSTVKESKNTLVEEIVEVSGEITGSIPDVVTEVSNIDVIIDLGSESDSINTVEDSVVVSNVEIDNGSMSIPAFPAVQHFIGKFYDGNPAEYYYFVYEPTTELYPDLTASNVYTTQLEMLPIVSLRNNGVSITSDKLSARYLQSKEILDTLGIEVDSFIEGIEDSASIADVMDAFVYFAVEPTDTSSIVSRALYDTFSFVYDDNALYTPADPNVVGSSEGYSITVTEGVFNAATAWKNQSKLIVVNTIGDVGTYEHEIVGDALVVRKQETPSAYVQYTFNTMTSITLIDRAGADDVGSTTVSIIQEGFVIPLSQHFVGQLTPMEQTELFAKSLHLSIYAAQVTHLEYYETEAFGNFLSFVAIVVIVVVTVLSFGAATDKAIWLTNFVIKLAAAAAISFALNKVFESTDNELVRVLATVAATFAMVQLGDTSEMSNGVIIASSLSTATTLYATNTVAVGMQELEDKQRVLDKQLSTRQEEFDKEKGLLDAGLDTEYIVGRNQIEPNKAYMESIDSGYHVALGGLQYNNDIIYDIDRQVGDLYENAYRLDLNRSLS